jgi:hypothetical protein
MITTTTLPTVADMASYLQWQEYYTERFARVSDSVLTSYWYLYGRDSEEPRSPRESAAYGAVNEEITARDIQP